MEGKRTQERKQKKSRWPLRHRATAFLLALVMIFASSGMRVQAESGDSSEETVIEQSVEEAAEGSNSDDTLSSESSIDHYVVTDDTVTETEVPTESPDVTQTPDETPAPSDDAAQAGSDSSSETEEITQESANISVTTSSTTRLKTRAAGEVEDYDITNLLTADSSMRVKVDGVYYTLQELNEKGIKVPKGATVDVTLVWDIIPSIQKDQNLVYQIPTDLVHNIVEEERFMFSANGEFAGYMTLSPTGLFTVEIDSSYYNKWSKKQGTGSLELDYLTLEFYASLSEDRGEHQGNDDNKFVFKEQTDAYPYDEVSFTIPFEYKNENAAVTVSKSNSFDAATQTVSYTVEVTAPESNTMTATNVVLTDVFDSSCTQYLVSSGTYGYYQNVTATKSDGTSISIADNFVFTNGGGKLYIGSMKPGEKVTVTYKVKVTDSYFSNNGSSTQIENKATVSYNTDGTASTTSTVTAGGTVKIEKSYGSLVSEVNESDANTVSYYYYVPYTVKVTAYGGKVTGISVEDVFTQNPDAIDYVVVDTGSPSAGTAVVNNSKEISWTGITLEEGQSATLTYKAYLNTKAWQLPSTTKSSATTDQKSRTLDIINAASLYVDGTKYDTVSKKLSLTKLWLNKGNIKQSDGSIAYTLTINQNLMTNDVSWIEDGIEYGGTMDYDKGITVYVYKDASGSQQIEGSPFTLTKADLTSATDTSWRIDLSTVKDGVMKGAYYYKVCYYATSDGTTQNIKNGAGIGLGDGTEYWQLKYTEAISISALKIVTGLQYEKYFATWKSTMKTAVDAGATYVDYVTKDNLTDGCVFFTLDNINSIQVNLQTGTDAKGNPIYEEVDSSKYEIVPYNYNYSGSSTAVAISPKYGDITEGYQGFKITFKEAISCSSAKPLVIIYDTYVNKENIYYQICKRYGGNADSDNPLTTKSSWALGDGKYDGANEHATFTNAFIWTLSSGLTKTGSYCFSKRGGKDTIKAGNFDPTTGLITWKIFINRFGDMKGKVTLKDIIPEGLTVVDVSYAGGCADELAFGVSKDQRCGVAGINTTDSVTASEPVFAQVDGGQEMTINLSGMKGYNFYADETKGTLNYSAYYTFNNNFSCFDWFTPYTITVVTRVDDLTMLTMGLDKDSSGNVQVTSFKNSVNVQNDGMAQVYDAQNASATVSVALNAGKTNLSKSMAEYSSGNYVTYTMNVNTAGADLLYTEDNLTVYDVMGDKCTLATNKNNYFKVYDVTDSESPVDITDQCSWEKVEDYDGEGTKYVFTVPDSTPIKITYIVKINAAIGETVSLTNKAYFGYQGEELSDYAVESKNNVQIVIAAGDSSTSAYPIFYVDKVDQLGNPVEGVHFDVYTVKMEDGKVVFGSDGQPVLDEKLDEGDIYTNRDGKVMLIGKNETETTNYIYCIVETSAPDGYVITNPRTYVEFYYHPNSGLDNVVGLEYWSDEVTIVNQAAPGELSVPISKTINDLEMDTDVDFTFTLTKTSGHNVYSDISCTTPVSSVTGTITGSGTGVVDSVYFNQAGEYKFTLTENDMTDAQKNEGFTKDDTVYEITVMVVKNGDNSLSITEATYTSNKSTNSSGDLLGSGVASFNNTLALNPTSLTLNAVKRVDTRYAKDTTGGTFTFQVLDNGEVVSTGTVGADGGDITFEPIKYTQNDLRTHYLVIREVTPSNDQKLTGITYTTKTAFAIVEVSAGSNNQVVAKVLKYSAQSKDLLDENGYPIFVNEYTATGTLNLTGTKKLLYQDQTTEKTVRAGEFTFTVTENGKEVATGTTLNGGTIQFTPITYNSAKTGTVGTHTYVITEDQGDDLYVEYTTETITVEVSVEDAGDGTLNARVVKVGNDSVSTTGNYDITFTNVYTLAVPTGVHLDFVPYVAVFLVAAGTGVTLAVRKRKHK